MLRALAVLLPVLSISIGGGVLLLVQPWASHAKRNISAACIDPFDTSALLNNQEAETAKPETEIPLPEALEL